MVHNFSPFLVRISGDLGVRWYGLAYITGFILAYLLIRWMCVRQKSGMTPDIVGDFITYGAIGILAGGRLGYCLFYDPSLFTKFKSSVPFWGVLAVNEGGMASHGGIIGLIIACIFFARKHGMSVLYLFDLIGITGPIGIFFGRLANFINGELVGRPSDPNFAWGVKFPSDIFQWSGSDPTKLSQLSTVVDKIPGLSADQWLGWVDQMRVDPTARQKINETLVQIVDQIQSGNEAAREAIGPLLVLRHPSQLYAAFGEGLLLFLILFWMARSPRKAGIIGASYLFFYGIIRISTEMFRMPDAHIGYDWLGLTRGQWLSIGPVVAGIVLYILWSRSGSVIIPGWARLASIKINRR